MRRERRNNHLLKTLLLTQGFVYVGTGLWPLIHIKSFMKVTGPKRDIWLVNTVGVLVTVIGAVFLLAARRKRVAPEVALLGTGAAAGLTGIDVVYVAKGTIWPIYLLDAVGESFLIAAWAMLWQGSEPVSD
jgi:hypothetical protein